MSRTTVRARLRSWARTRSVGRSAVAALGVAALAGASLMGVASAAQAAPGTPGVPQANSVVFEEDFENGAGTTPVLLTNYTGATGQTYTADPAWLTNCNGIIVNFNIPFTDLGNCVASGDSANLRQLAYALGAHAGTANPAANDVVAAYTENNPGANAVEFETVDNITLASASGRFLTFSVDTAAVNCGVSAPLYQFSFLNQAGAATPVGGILNACSSGTTETVPAIGPLPTRAINVGTYTSNGSVLFNGSELGIRMTNANGSGVGNDAAFDNIRILDVTPQLDKVFSPAQVVAGFTSTLTLTVTNTDELAAKNGWSFTDALPAGLTIAGPASTTCSAGVVDAPLGGTEITASGNLNAGQASCTVSVDVTSPVAGSFTNGPDNITSTGLNPPADTTVEFVPQAPAIRVVKSANPEGDFVVGQTVNYSFVVSNTGNVPLTDVEVTETEFSGTGELSDIVCPAGAESLAVGDDVTCTASYVVTQADVDAGVLTNAATATGTSPEGESPVSPESEVSIPSVDAAPALTIDKTSDVETISAAGDEIEYSFLITNTGNVTLYDVTATEGEFSGTGELSEVVCPAEAAVLAPGDDVTCTATYVATQDDVDAGSITNAATATGTPPNPETPTPVSPSDEVTVEVPAAPALTIDKTASSETASVAGETITYSFLITNTGNVTLSDVSVAEGEFSGTGELSDVVCAEGAASLAPGDDVICTATYVVTQEDVDAGSITNAATATGTPPNPETPAPVSPSDEVTVEIPAAPALTVVKTADEAAQEDIVVGQEITYSFLITNTGNVTLGDVTVVEGEFSGAGELSEVVCPEASASLTPGAQVTCTATYTVVQADIDAGGVTNTASATGTPPNPETPAPEAPESEVVVPGVSAPALDVVKTASVDRATTVGQAITYSFLVTNTGNVTISDVTVSEGEFTGTGTLSAVTCPATAESLAPGAQVTCTATYAVTQADLDRGSIRNTATAGGTTPGGDPIASGSSSANVETPGAPLATTGGANLLPVAGGALLLLIAGGVILLVRRRTHADN
ncbi:hypothetical protein ACI3KS_09790 [Microbacterium sp. ZW T5_45]|uniref:DUF7507 domain-containing protein n=1 Tax=Microbacterium sp. ZW T5_45 TaxID=3378080 RepID=UPI0038526466